MVTELRYHTAPGKWEGDFLAVDYAKLAEAYGAKGYTVRTMAELAAAMEDAKTVTDRPVLFDIKVLPKSMTDGYGAWWRVGTPQVSENERNRACWQEHLEHVESARKY